MAEADGVRADVAVEPVPAVADVEVGAGVRGAGEVRRRRGVARGRLRRAARLRELALREGGGVRPRPELRDVGRGDGAVAVPVGVGVVARGAELPAGRGLRDRGVGLVDLAVAVDVLRGEVPRLAVVSVGVVCDAEGEGARPADGRDDAELVIREVRGLDEVPPSAQVARDDARRSFGQPSSQSMSPEVWGDMIVRCTLDRRS